MVFMILTMILAMSTQAHALVVTEGTVTTGRSTTQLAAMGGMISSVNVQAGAYVQSGDIIARLNLEAYYAPCDGTIEAIFAETGSSAEDVSDKYGGVLSIAPESAYTLYATAEYAYESLRTQAIKSGQTVYMKCTTNGTHRGTGRITEIDGEIFTIEATGGEFYNGETVYIYLEDDYDTADRLGKGTVIASTVEAVSAEGDIVNLYVGQGDFVEKGQLLFETVGALDQGQSSAGLELCAETEGYVTAVYATENQRIDRGEVLIEICPIENLILTAYVPETEITALATGDAAIATFELTDEILRLNGTVVDISYLPDGSEEVRYAVHIALECDDRIAPGMTASVALGS